MWWGPVIRHFNRPNPAGQAVLFFLFGTIRFPAEEPSMTQPLIGLTLDSDEGTGLTKTVRYQLKSNYADAIAGAGGMPVGLPHAPESVEAYADRLDAPAVTGGASA